MAFSEKAQMKKFTQESFLEYARDQLKLSKGDVPEVAAKRRDALTKAVSVAQGAGDADFEVEIFKAAGDKTTPNTEQVFDLKASAPQAARYDSAVAQNFDVLLGEASKLAKAAEAPMARELGLDEQGFPDDMNDAAYLKGLPKKPRWDFDR